MSSYGNGQPPSAGVPDGQQPRPPRRSWPVAPTHAPSADAWSPAGTVASGDAVSPGDAASPGNAVSSGNAASPGNAASGNPVSAAEPEPRAEPSTRPAVTGALNGPTDLLAQVPAHAPTRTRVDPGWVPSAPAPAPVSPGPVPVSPGPVMLGPGPQAPARPGPYDLPSAPADPSRRARPALLALVAGLTVVVLVGVVAVVLALRPDHSGTGPAIAASGAGLRAATSSPGGAAPEQAANAASTGASPRPSGSASAPGHGSANSGIAGDEFTGTRLDTTKWSVYGADAGSAFSPTAVRVSGGELQVLGIGKNPTAAANQAGGVCWCKTAGDHVYGTWQVRARFDAGAGYGMVIGLWPGSDNADIDGYVTFASDSDAARKSLGMTLNQPGVGGTNQSAGLAGDFTAWHTYAVDWRATYVKVSVDGKVIYDSTKQATRPAIPSKPMHLVIQQAKGPTAGIPAANSSTPAQVILHVDSVHFTP